MRPSYPLIVLCLLSILSGCVRRRLTVRTSPPGAVVSVDNQTIGTSPAASSFTYYGTRELRIEKDGFRTETIKRRLDPPWYEAPGLDFISETLWPWEIRDERIIDVQLVPETIEPTETVLQRADQLRAQSRAGLVTSPQTPVP
ncbi:MAG: PEGA domain-containing protein [Planctomycetaceae bacterium]